MKMSKSLIACGLFVAPVFYLVAGLQLMIRPDFDIRVLPISFLSLGELGWIQVLSFIVTGLLSVLCALGLRTLLKGEKGGTWGPILIGLFGIGMILAGFCRPDPMSAPGATPAMSLSGALHMAGFLIAFLSLIAACFVFMRRFLSSGQKSWAIYSAATGIIVPVLVALSMTAPTAASLVIAGAGLVLFGWLGVVALRLMGERHLAI